MKSRKIKTAKSLEAVTHTHTHTHTFIQVYRRIGGQSGERESFNLKKEEKTAQKSCAYLRYKDGLCRIVCLFFVPDSS